MSEVAEARAVPCAVHHDTKEALIDARRRYRDDKQRTKTGKKCGGNYSQKKEPEVGGWN